MIPRASRLALLALVLAGILATPARSQDLDPPPPTPTPVDTSFTDYLDSLRDSTDVYFQQAVAPVDTAGLDSALAAALASPPGSTIRYSREWRPDIGPWFTFNRLDGPVYGGTIATGRRRGPGAIGGVAGYGVGSDTWLGHGWYRKSRRYGDAEFEFTAEAGRWTSSMDRERPNLKLAAFRALTFGSDSRRYLRQDGLRLGLTTNHLSWRGRVAYRDQHESPLEPTARWSIFNEDLRVPDNLAATRGHTHELGYLLGARVPGLPFTAEAEYFSSSRRIGSDFEYRRTKLSIGGDLSIGRAFAIVPQFMYARLSGDAVGQSMFYLGGHHTMRSIEGDSRGGTGLVLAKLDVLELPDVLEVLRIPHPAMLPIQVGAFVATGAVWGVDPYGGPTRPGVDWPMREDFIHEAGVSIQYRPGIPDPTSFIELSWAWPIGPHADGPRFTASYRRGVDLVLPFGIGEGP